MKRISVRLSIRIAIVATLCLAASGAVLTYREVQVVQQLVLHEAQSVALSGAAAYQLILEQGIDSGALSIFDVVQPTYEEMHFVGDHGETIHPKHKRYHTKLGDYTDAHGVQQLQDTLMASGGFLFASGIDIGGYVPSPHAAYDHYPRGTDTPENAAWDLQNSRGKIKYNDPEPLSAARFMGDGTLTQDYERDTGESAWDVVAPITVKGQHFGAFRVGVPKDRVNQQYRELLVGLSVLFGMLVLAIVGAIAWSTGTMIRPLTELTDTADWMSQTGDPADLSKKIECTTRSSEIAKLARVLNRLRISLLGAMQRHDASEIRPMRSGTVIHDLGATTVGEIQ